MKETISYIFRKPDPKYKSIEGLFYNISKLIGLDVKTTTIELKFSGGSLGVLWSNLKNLRRLEQNIYHITGDVQYMALVTGRKSVLTVHDVKSIVRGSLVKQIYMKLFWFWLPALFVNRITVISEFTKKELEDIVPFAKHKISVVYNPVNESFKYFARDFNSSKPRILLLGTKVNKNLERVFKALEAVNCEIILIGKLTNDQEKLSKKLGLSLITKFNLTLDQVVKEYNGCDLLCFVSTYEGFGMPIIEAQSVGRPVVTSNLGAMKEVAEDSALLVDPFDITSIRSGILSVIENEALRNLLIEKGLNNVQRFSTKSIAKEYMKIYNELSTGANRLNKDKK